MDELSGLAAYDVTLLPQAIACAQAIKAKFDRVPTQEELKRTLHCSSVAAKRLQHFIANNDVTKIADKMEAAHPKAVTRALVQVATDSAYKTDTEFLVKEIARLTKQVAKNKFEKRAETSAREEQVREELASLRAQGMAEARIPDSIARPKTLSGNMLEVNVPDAHFGKLAWGVETGAAPYDTKIAAAMYLRAVLALLDRAKENKYDEIVFVVGNDILNSNDSENKTAHGTIVTTDGRYHKTFWKVRETIVTAIEEMRKYARVRVILVYGNHDTLSAWHLGDSLECYFHKYDDVKIHNEPRYRKYHEFGKCMLLLTHGDKGQRDDYPLLMATEEPEMWARTKHREAHTGHQHTTKTQEYHGVRVRILPALCPPDDWHAENGYVGNLRNAEAYAWNKDQGLFAQYFYNDDSQPSLTTKRKLV